MTEEFQVKPDKLDAFADRLGQLATDHAQAAPYAQKWLTVDDGAGGVFLTGVVDTLAQIRDDLADRLSTLSTVTSGSAAELVKAAQMYRTTDRATAAALDQTYVGAGK
ncbi:type VII secretion target [Nocardia thailandica]|uniref:Type VII secretion target n=1 Tax=Nocardia thailandica TaxID=257275 RepID=A0ABW6PLG6_9NOCA